MIDIENKVYTVIKQNVPKNVHMASAFETTQSKFPVLTVNVIANDVNDAYRDSARIENIANISIEINAYSNKVGHKKEEAKSIIGTVDNVLSEMGFTRDYCQPTPNLEDATIFRMTARYSANVDNDFNVYRR